jgi:hypothetical protein
MLAKYEFLVILFSPQHQARFDEKSRYILPDKEEKQIIWEMVIDLFQVTRPSAYLKSDSHFQLNATVRTWWTEKGISQGAAEMLGRREKPLSQTGNL